MYIQTWNTIACVNLCVTSTRRAICKTVPDRGIIAERQQENDRGTSFSSILHIEILQNVRHHQHIERFRSIESAGAGVS